MSVNVQAPPPETSEKRKIESAATVVARFLQIFYYAFKFWADLHDGH